jgi:hypothetical protein
LVFGREKLVMQMVQESDVIALRVMHLAPHAGKAFAEA